MNMDRIASIIAQFGDMQSTLTTILMALGAFTGTLVMWILYQLKSAVDKNSALLISLIEVQIVRATQAAKDDDNMRGVVDMVKANFENARK